MADIVVSGFHGNFIKKDGVCYEFVETTADPVDTNNNGIEQFISCDDCFSNLCLGVSRTHHRSLMDTIAQITMLDPWSSEFRCCLATNSFEHQSSK